MDGLPTRFRRRSSIRALMPIWRRGRWRLPGNGASTPPVKMASPSQAENEFIFFSNAEPENGHKEHTKMKPKNTICLWFDKGAHEAASFYAATFPDSKVTAVHPAPGDFPGGRKGEVLTVEFTVIGIPCLGLNGGPAFRHTEAFPSRSRRRARMRPTATGMPSSAMAARKASAVGARIAGASRGRSPRAR